MGIKSPMVNKSKKKTDKLVPSRKMFIDGCIKKGIDEDYATNFWDKTIIGLADYQFNKSHSVN
jgi:DNA polymerase III alpha subunit